MFILKNSVNRITAVIESLKPLLPNCDLTQILKIHFESNELNQTSFGAFNELEEFAYGHIKKIYSEQGETNGD